MDDSMLFLVIGIIIALIFIVNKISDGIINEKKNVLKLKKELDIQRQAQQQKEYELNSRQSYLEKKKKNSTTL